MHSLNQTLLRKIEGQILLTDGGLETVMVFLEGLDLPQFASFTLLESNEGRAALIKYYKAFLDEAAVQGAGFVLEQTANPMLTGFTLPKLLWVRDNEPAAFARIRKVMLPKDWIRFQLTGEYVSDVSDASGTGLFDVVNRRWRCHWPRSWGWIPLYCQRLLSRPPYLDA